MYKYIFDYLRVHVGYRLTFFHTHREKYVVCEGAPQRPPATQAEHL